jgi:hypothetical protein
MSVANLVACPDCTHMVSRLAVTCPSCARPLRKTPPSEGLFLRTMNQAVAAAFWIPVSLVAITLVAVAIGVLLRR